VEFSIFKTENSISESNISISGIKIPILYSEISILHLEISILHSGNSILRMENSIIRPTNSFGKTEITISKRNLSFLHQSSIIIPIETKMNEFSFFAEPALYRRPGPNSAAAARGGGINCLPYCNVTDQDFAVHR
jgi:hypothetical protein